VISNLYQAFPACHRKVQCSASGIPLKYYPCPTNKEGLKGIQIINFLFYVFLVFWHKFSLITLPMNLRNYLFIIFLILSINTNVFAQQDKKPKIALVLSGGGAKGIAHIKTLQVLDSLGIVPDLIVGTSMGSIIGGFYAMGYSGDSIAKISQSQDWKKLLAGIQSLKDVSVEEKSQFNNGLLTVNWINKKPKVTPAFLNDQKLREFFARISYPVFDINDFDKLPIPYRAIAMDIVEGKQVVMGEGSIGVAMRASMSIPTIFLPVNYKDMLLIDGGVINNFPTDIAEQLGADIIIGSDVGGGMLPKEKLDNIPSILFQTSMYVSKLKNPKNRKRCTILIDHVPNVKYNTGDFAKSKEIYNLGFIAVNEVMPQLIDLANQLKKYPKKEIKIPYKPEKFILDTVIFNTVSSGNFGILHKRMRIQPGKEYHIDDIIQAVNHAMGTNLFDKISYEPIISENTFGIEFNVKERSQHRLSGAIHYDSHRGAGIFVNYTGRNLLGNASRIVLGADIAQQPGYRIQYQKFFGKNMNWWFRSEFMGQRLIQQFYIYGKKADDIKHNYFQFNNQFNKNINPFTSYAGLVFNFDNSNLKPVVDPELNDNIFNLQKYKYVNFQAGVQYSFNSMDRISNPEEGFKTYVLASRSLYSYVDVIYSDGYEEKGNTNGFTRLFINLEKRWKLNKKSTFIAGADIGLTFLDDFKNDDLSYEDFGLTAMYHIGGTIQRARNTTIMFPGLHDGELFATQIMMLRGAYQYEILKNIMIIPHANLSSVGFSGFSDYIQEAFNPKGNWKDFDETGALISAGVTASYHSLLGPITFDVSWVNNIHKTRLFFGLGIQFNRSY
jgi:NTE family protein